MGRSMVGRTMAKRKRNEADETAPGAALWAAFGMLIVIFLGTALLTFSSTDWPNPHVFPHPDPVENACGRVGAWFSFHVIRLLGLGAYPLLLGVLVACYWRLARGPVPRVWTRVVAVFVLAIIGSTVIETVSPGGSRHMPNGYAGVLGGFVGSLLRQNFNLFGTTLILGYCGLAALVFAVDGLGQKLASGASVLRDHAAEAGRKSGVAMRDALDRGVTRVSEMLSRPEPAEEPTARSTTRRARSVTPAAAPEPELEDEPAPQVTRRNRSSSRRAEPAPPEPEVAKPSAPAEPKRSLAEVRDIVFRNHRQDPQEKTGCYPAVLDDWVLPPVTLLHAAETQMAAQQETLAREKAQILEETLRDFRIEAPVVQIDTGPVITMFELRVAPGVKVSRIIALSNDLARALKAPAVRVVAPIPGKNTVGIEVPRIDRERVRMRELMAATGRQASKMKLPLYLGKDASGTSIVNDLTRMPHMLIAGTTGSGKSVCINSIIMSVLMTQRPDRVKLVLIDPKMVELSVFKDVPHLMCPIVTDMQKAERILEWACMKMDERYSVLAEAGVRNIADFNNLSDEQRVARFNPDNKEEISKIPGHLPYMVIVIDELADLMMTAAKEVEYHLARLAQKSRAVGIHIVVATQRPEAKVVTGLIKSNLPCRCAFRVAARMDSRIVLDQNGAEVLLGQGDMLYLPPGSANLMRAQGTYVEDEEIHSTVRDLASKGKCDYHPELMQIRNGPKGEVGERDELFEDAVQIILESQRGSVSLLQRRLTIGYSRASRLVDQMADAGIVGDYKGSQAREVLMSLDEWNSLKKQIESELTDGYAADSDDFEEDESKTIAETNPVAEHVADESAEEEEEEEGSEVEYEDASEDGQEEEEEGEDEGGDEEEVEYEYEDGEEEGDEYEEEEERTMAES